MSRAAQHGPARSPAPQRHCERSQDAVPWPVNREPAVDAAGKAHQLGRSGRIAQLVGGSGSALTACEKTGRQARLVELDPKYCDVIVQRWQAWAGEVATLEGDSRSFEENSPPGQEAAAA